MDDTVLLSWPPELRAAALCVKAAVWPESSTVQEMLSKENCPTAIDWQRFLFWVGRHRIVPLVNAGIDQLPQLSTPEPIRTELRMQAATNARRMLRLSGELICLFRGLKALGIRAVPLKGPLLSLQVHGDITMRQVRDLDLLLAAEDLDAGVDFLLRQGYGLYPGQEDPRSLSHGKRAVWKRHTNQLGFVKREEGLTVELHWDCMQELLPTRLEELWSRTTSLRLGGENLPALSVQDLVPYLAVHGAKHSWRRLSWLVEFSRVIGGYSEDGWAETIEQVEKKDIARPLIQGTLVAHRLFQIPLPTVARTWIGKDASTWSLADHALKQIAEEPDRIGPGLPSLQNSIYLSRLRRNRDYRVRTLFKPFLCVADFTEIDLPDRLLWLYIFLRPVFWFKRHWLSDINRRDQKRHVSEKP